MSNPTEEFFTELGRRGHDPRLAAASGAIRVAVHRDGDLNGTRAENWLITLGDGDVAVARGKAPADSVIHVERTLADHMVTGQTNAVAALLRGEMIIEGKPELALQLQRLFPGPPSDRREPVAPREPMAQREGRTA
jgi:hypothetical protein